jgi:hypothetical protein
MMGRLVVLIGGVLQLTRRLMTILWKEPVKAKGPVRTTALWLLAGWVCYLVVHALRTGRPFSAVFGSAIGGTLFAVVSTCFVLGVFARVLQWVGRTSNRNQTNRRSSGGGRAWSDEAPRRRRHRRDDDPALPLRGRK